jgi:hypothetical protein
MIERLPVCGGPQFIVGIVANSTAGIIRGVVHRLAPNPIRTISGADRCAPRCGAILS